MQLLLDNHCTSKKLAADILLHYHHQHDNCECYGVNQCFLNVAKSRLLLVTIFDGDDLVANVCHQVLMRL